MTQIAWLLSHKVARLRVGRILEMTLSLLLLSLALAGGDGTIDFNTSLTGIPATLCNLANFIYGPVGWAVVLIILAIGIIRWFSGANGGIGLTIGALVGAIVLRNLPAISTGLSFGECVLGAAGG